jgi:hypothetical protein
MSACVRAVKPRGTNSQQVRRQARHVDGRARTLATGYWLAGERRWPRAPITNSSIVLGLAKLGAAGVTKRKGKAR